MAQESSLGVESGVALSPPYRPLGAGWRRRKVGLRPQGWEEVLSQALPLRLPAFLGDVPRGLHRASPGISSFDVPLERAPGVPGAPRLVVEMVKHGL